MAGITEWNLLSGEGSAADPGRGGCETCTIHPFYLNNQEFFLNYAAVCQYMNRHNDSILLLKEAIKINPNNSVPFLKMGFIEKYGFRENRTNLIKLY